jgi:propionyl-CoA carboxylase alpha chain
LLTNSFYFASCVCLYSLEGTCEFLVDKNKNFYFLEMNTRLQVEHPVTEQITGIDLVEQMIRIAAGLPISVKQNEIKINGWALESRVYAEDPLRGFLPSIGTLSRYNEPKGNNIRIDSGIREGNEISIYYDPMISKLITYGANRTEALQKMREALDSYVIRGVTHNINFLRSLCDHPRFIAGNLTTKFIPDEYPNGYKGANINDEETNAIIAAATLIYTRLLHNQVSINNKLSSFSIDDFLTEQLSELHIKFLNNNYSIKTQSYSIINSILSLNLLINNSVAIEINSDYSRGDYVFQCNVNGCNYTMQTMQINDGLTYINLTYAGSVFSINILNKKQFDLQQYMPIPKIIDTSKLILSPMPGAVFSIKVNEGDSVVAGQEICVVEAMKMQNALRAQSSGKVKALHVKKGQTVQADQLLVELQ